MNEIAAHRQATAASYLDINDTTEFPIITTNNSTTEIPGQACDTGIALMRFVSEVCLSLPIALFGIIGNILSFTILQAQRHKQSTTIYLISLSIADIFILTSSVLIYSLRYIPACLGVFTAFDKVHQYIFVAAFPCLYFFRFASTWLTVSLTFDRWIVVCYPLSAQRRCTLSRAYKQVRYNYRYLSRINYFYRR